MAEAGASAILKLGCQPLKLCRNLPSHHPSQRGASSPPPSTTPSPLRPQLSPGQSLKAGRPAAPSASSCTRLFTREGAGPGHREAVAGCQPCLEPGARRAGVSWTLPKSMSRSRVTGARRTQGRVLRGRTAGPGGSSSERKHHVTSAGSAAEGGRRRRRGSWARTAPRPPCQAPGHLGRPGLILPPLRLL